MRDTGRISPFLRTLAEFWEQHPDQRFGQLILNLSRDSTGRIRDIWEWDIEKFEEAIREYKSDSDMSNEELVEKLLAQNQWLKKEVAETIVERWRNLESG